MQLEFAVLVRPSPMGQALQRSDFQVLFGTSERNRGRISELCADGWRVVKTGGTGDLDPEALIQGLVGRPYLALIGVL